MKNPMPQAIIATPSTRLKMCCPANTTGALLNNRHLIRPYSLPKAMTDPENVIAPTKLPMNSSRRLPRGIGTGMPKATGLLTAATAMSTADRPTSECIAATSSGILVISTRRAITAPIEPPITAAITTMARLPLATSTSVVNTARVMPSIPKKLPRRAVSGCDKPLSANMKKTAAIR